MNRKSKKRGTGGDGDGGGFLCAQLTTTEGQMDGDDTNDGQPLG